MTSVERAFPAGKMSRNALASLGTEASCRYLIEDVYPSIDGGRYAVKRIVGEPIEVWADIFRDGHEVAAAALVWRAERERRWRREPMTFHNNDRWYGEFTPPEPGRYCYAIEAWTDEFATWRRDFLLKRDAGQNVGLEAREGALILKRAKLRNPADFGIVREALASFERDGSVEALLASPVMTVMTHAETRADLARSAEYSLYVDRPLARSGAWYEMVPRSQGRVPGLHGTFDDCIARLPEIAALGFDVVYLPPIHPIGRINRKGRNNALRATPNDPGSFYAIGSKEGGHDAVHPELGTLADFRRFVAACHEQGMEVALDYALQCSPDHPWLSEHPEWFRRRPDGSMPFAENPPKKYEDIVNPDFYCEDKASLWAALRDIVLFWREQGVRVFRVDNPHTKPLPFWEWMIREVQTVDPGVIFLSEAFTRPKVMKALAKLGFTQSYTYFTWRTSKAELQAYLTEITGYPEHEYLRPNFFTNTPDILPFHLQSGEPWMFKARFALAATLSGNYGIYNGFELIEHEPVSGKEEYFNSEKYEIKTRDWNKPANIKDYIGRLNARRRENPALLQTSNLRFAQVDDDHVVGFVKEAPLHDNAVAVAITLSGEGPREFWFHFGDMTIGPRDYVGRVSAIENLATGERHVVEWGGVRLRIDPQQDPMLLFRCYS
jgi:starch synthase (maltosyl-transferring)